MRKKSFWRLLAALYAAAVLLCAIGQLMWVSGMKDAEPQQLSVQDAVLSSIRTDYGAQWLDYRPDDMLATDGDPQIIWTVEGMVSGLRVRLKTSQPVKDAALYYTTAPGQEFSLERRLDPMYYDAQTGAYLFRLPKAVYVHTLRLDPTGAAGSFIQAEEILLNPPLTAEERYLPAVGWLLTALFAPPLLTVALREGMCLAARKKQTEGRPAWSFLYRKG